MRITQLCIGLITASILLVCHETSAQEDEKSWRLYRPASEREAASVNIDTTREGSVRFHKDSQLDSLIADYRNVKESDVKIEGFTVQIAISQKSADVNRLQADFLRKHPNVPAKIDYKQPNFRLRVGRFYDRLSAERFLSEISSQYPGAIVLKDQIDLPVIPDKSAVGSDEKAE